MGASWDELRTAFADGKTTEHRADATDDRCIEFEDGTLWFPDGVPDPQAAKAGPAALFGLTLMVSTESECAASRGHRPRPLGVGRALGQVEEPQLVAGLRRRYAPSSSVSPSRHPFQPC